MNRKVFIVFITLYNVMRIIRKVWEHKGTGQLIVTIPKDSKIKKGDYVEIKKVR